MSDEGEQVKAELMRTVMMNASRRIEDKRADDDWSSEDVDVLVDEAMKVVHDISQIVSVENTAEEKAQIELLECILDRYLLAIRYS